MGDGLHGHEVLLRIQTSEDTLHCALNDGATAITILWFVDEMFPAGLSVSSGEVIDEAEAFGIRAPSHLS